MSLFYAGIALRSDRLTEANGPEGKDHERLGLYIWAQGWDNRLQELSYITHHPLNTFWQARPQAMYCETTAISWNKAESKFINYNITDE